jgi:hypothetical protein
VHELRDRSRDAPRERVVEPEPVEPLQTPGKSTAVAAPGDSEAAAVRTIARVERAATELAAAIGRRAFADADAQARAIRAALRRARSDLGVLAGQASDGLVAAQRARLDALEGEMAPLLAAAPTVDADPADADAEARWHESLESNAATPDAIVTRATRAPAIEYPHRAAIERSFGRSITAVAHAGPAATRAAGAIDATAFAHGNKVVFASSSPSLFVAAHEAAHTLQSSTMVQRHAADGGGGDDPFEAHADAVASRVVAGQSAADLLDGASGAAGEGVIRRKDNKFDYQKFLDTPVGPNRYMRDNAKDLYFAVKARLPTLVAGLPSDFLSFVGDDSGPFLRKFLDVSMDAANGRDYDEWPEVMRRVLAPEDIRQLVDKGRVLTGKGKDEGTSEEFATGPRRWYPSAAAGVIEALLRRLQESLRRVVPKYLAARCGPGVAPPAAGHEWPQPDPSAILASHPIDSFTIHALCAPNLVAVDGAAYRSELEITGKTPVPKAGAADLGVLKPGIDWRFVDDPKAPNVIVINKPANPTAEQVATTFFGDSTFAHKIVAAPPLFAFPLSDAIALRKRASLPVPSQVELMTVEHLIDIARDPAYALLRGAKSEDAALAQSTADKLVVDATDRGAVLKSLEATVYALKACQGLVRRFGSSISMKLAPTIEYLQAKLVRFATAPDAEIGRWATQVEKQYDIVVRAAIGLQGVEQHLVNLKLDDPSAVDKIPPVIRKPLERVARDFVDAAVMSRLVVAGDDKVAMAERDLELVPLETIEVILADVRGRMHAFKSIPVKFDPAENDGGDVWDGPGMGRPPGPVVKYSRDKQINTEAELRKELTVIRALVLARDPKAGERIKALFKAVDTLNTETEVGTTHAGLAYVIDRFLEKMKSAWTVLVGKGPEAADLGTKAIHYQFVFKRAWSHCVAGKPEAAQAHIKKELGSDPLFPKFLQTAFDSLESIEDRVMIAKIALMVGIAIVSMGVGAAVEGVALGLGAGQIGAFLASSAAEAIAFTALDHVLLGSGDATGSLISNFVGNLATFGLLKAWRLRKAATVADDAIKAARHADATRLQKLTGYYLKGKELTAETFIVVATQYVQMQIDSVRKNGKFLSLSEQKEAGKQGLAMMLGVAIGGRVFKSHIDELRRVGFKVTAELEEKFAAIRQMAKTVEGTKDPKQALELVRQDRALLEHELHAHGYKTGSAGPKGAPDAPKQLGTDVKNLDGAEMLLGLDEVVPGKTFVGPPDEVAAIVAKLHERGAKTQRVTENGAISHLVVDGNKRYTIHEAKHYTVTRSGGAVAKQPLVMIEPNSVVGHVKNINDGRALLRRLVSGDRTALADLGYDSFPPGIKTNEVEWGLGRRWDGKIAVVLGSFHEINWAHLPHVTPLSHTHPISQQTKLHGPDGTGEVSIAKLGDLDNDMAKLFPSASDVSLMARGRIKDHHVHTGYVARGGDRVGNARPGDKGGTVDMVIEKAEYAGRWQGQEDLGVYKATISARADGKVIWRGEVWAIDGGASFMYKNKPPISKSKLGPPGGEMRLGSGGSDKLHDPLDGLYNEHIDPKVNPKGWNFKDTKTTLPDGSVKIESIITYGTKDSGQATRVYKTKPAKRGEPAEHILVMEDIQLGTLPRKVEHPNAMTDTGTRTSAFVTMRQMKLLGIKFGTLTKARMTNVRNVETVLALHTRGATADRVAVRGTKSVDYATTALEQSGHQVVVDRISVELPKGGTREKLGELMDDMKVPPADQKALLEKYKAHAVTRDTEVVTGYNITIPVIPHPKNPVTVPAKP